MSAFGLTESMRLDGYIRVSRVAGREGASFISPKVQRERIEALAAAGGHEIVRWHEDLDQPGSRATRPGFVEALRRVEAGETDGIAVAKLDRFARSVADAAAAIRRINDAGGALLSAHETLDTSTPFGRFALNMMLSLAELELDRIRESWHVARREAVARGVHIASRTPTGYRRAADGRLEPDPLAGPAIRELFLRRAAGASWGELAHFLDERGVQGPYRARNWTSKSVSNIVGNRAYVGEARSGEFVLPGAHEPLVDQATFLSAQRQVMTAVRGEGGLLAGLLRCSGCRYVMKADTMRDRDGEMLRLYRCRGRYASGICESRASILGRVVEPYVTEWFFAEIGAEAVTSVTRDGDMAAAERAAAEADEDMRLYRDSKRVKRALGEERFLEGLEIRAARLDGALAELHRLREARGLRESLGELGLEAAWPELSVKEQNAILRRALDAVFVRRVIGGGRHVPVAERLLLCAAGEGPSGLPRPGLRHVAPLPLVFPGD